MKLSLYFLFVQGNSTSRSSSGSQSSRTSQTHSGPRMTLEELRAVNRYAESTRSLSYLPQVNYLKQNYSKFTFFDTPDRIDMYPIALK